MRKMKSRKEKMKTGKRTGKKGTGDGLLLGKIRICSHVGKSESRLIELHIPDSRVVDSPYSRMRRVLMNNAASRNAVVLVILVLVLALPVNAAWVLATKNVDPPSPNIYYPGDTIRYVISLENGHPTDDIRVDVAEDQFPDAGTAVSLDSSFDVSFPDPPYILTPGAKQVYEIDWQVPPGVTGVITNRCYFTGVQFSTLPEPFDVMRTRTSLIIVPGTLAGIWASPMQVSPAGTDVTLVITEENAGDVALTSPSVDLAPLALTLTIASPEFMGGDDGNGELDIGEIWTWVVIDVGVTDTKTYTATGHGIDPLGNDVTWCSNPAAPPPNTLCDQDEQDEVTVEVVPHPTCWDETQCHGDTDATGDVKGPDFLALKNSWYKVYGEDAYDPCADFDRNGEVKGSDFLILKDHWYQTVPADCPVGGVWPP
jgi:hypothetical protein